MIGGTERTGKEYAQPKEKTGFNQAVWFSIEGMDQIIEAVKA
jgi:hypothetical protein